MNLELDGKVALITGGNSGIGRATALAFAHEGAKVVVAARRAIEGSETVEMIQSIGGDATFVQTDVSQKADVIAMVDHCVATYGGLDIAFNNAGVEGTIGVSTVDYDEEVWNQVIDINLKGIWLCMKYQIPQMLARGNGSIVNMSSASGLGGASPGIAYSASKFGVVGMTKRAAKEYAPHGIRVNVVCPAVIKTPMADRLGLFVDEEPIEWVGTFHPLGRAGTPGEVASAVVWLCSDGAGFVTGHALAIDGGALI